MKFKFLIRLTDKEYLDFNIFWMFQAPYGKKNILKYRITLAVLFLAIGFLSVLGGSFSKDAFLGAIPYLIILVIIQLLLKPFFLSVLKGQLKSLKKKGKMGYSSVAEMEFFEDGFVEITPESKSEQKYSAIERISVVSDKALYIHVNNVMAYILPKATFESQEQYDAFLEFIKTKCATVDTY